VLELVTTPEGARIKGNGVDATTPAKLALGTLDAPLTVTLEKEGFEPATLVVDRVGFMLDEGEMRRRLSIELAAVRKPEPVAAAPERARAPSAAEEKRPPRRRAPKEPTPTPSEAPVAATPAAPATPVPAPAAPAAPVAAPVAASAAAPAPATPAPSAPAAAPAPQTPMQAAMACLAAGDNACVVRALEGKTSSARELEMLIETHRTMGQGGKAEELMKSYVGKYPSERRAAAYRAQLERKAAEAAPATPAPAAPAAPSTPQP
jgi:hypothetical protein